MAQRRPRLHLLFARDAPRAVILRRGPSAWYHVMRWNLLDDTIEHEAWNDSDQPRVILIFDIWNPLLSEAERELVSAMLLEHRDWIRAQPGST